MTESRGLEITVNPGSFAAVPEVLLESAVRRTLAEEGIPAAEFSVTLLDDTAIGALNREYLGKDRPTDVIAFSLGDGPEPLGDVYIGMDQALRQAGELGVSPEEELVRLAVHGTLHVLGYDHPEGSDRTGSAMFVLQERLVRLVMEGGSGA
ncbi:MAG TPA: rRNA maturation RNase YbeY [Longimicrobiales bacterium]|nr:rRNA maturation RNase YbeY [Longimicrobiales bacterium]